VLSSADHLALDANLSTTVVQVGVDPTLGGRALQDAARRAIATRRGSCSWSLDHAGWVVTLHSSDDQDFSDKTPEYCFASCLV